MWTLFVTFKKKLLESEIELCLHTHLYVYMLLHKRGNSSRAIESLTKNGSSEKQNDEQKNKRRAQYAWHLLHFPSHIIIIIISEINTARLLKRKQGVVTRRPYPKPSTTWPSLQCSETIWVSRSPLRFGDRKLNFCALRIKLHTRGCPIHLSITENRCFVSFSPWLGWNHGSTIASGMSIKEKSGEWAPLAPGFFLTLWRKHCYAKVVRKILFLYQRV